MADYISSWSVKMVADATGLASGFAKGASEIKSFVQTATTAAKTLGSSVSGSLQNLTGTAIGSALSPLGGIGSSLGSVFTALASSNPIGMVVGVASAAVAAAGAMFAFGVSSIQSIDATSRLANKVGTTTQEMLGLQQVAESRGLSFDDLKGGMEGYARELGKLRHELAGAQPGPMMTALANLGINAAEFIRLPIAQQMGQLAQGLSGIEDGMERMSLARSVLGRGGASLAPMLGADPSTFANLAAEAAASGQVISESQAAGIRDAALAFRTFKQAFSDVVGGIQTAVAVVFAPFAGFFSTTLRDAVTALAPAFRGIGIALVALPIAYFGTMIAAVFSVIRFMQPVLVQIGEAFGFLEKTMRALWEAFSPVISAFGELIGGMVGGLNPMTIWGDGVKKMAQTVGEILLVVGAAMAAFIQTSAREIAAVLRSLSTAAQSVDAINVALGGDANAGASARLLEMAGGLDLVSQQAGIAGQRLLGVNLNAAAAPGAAAPTVAGANPEWSARAQQLEGEMRLIGMTNSQREMAQALDRGLNATQAWRIAELVEETEQRRRSAEFADQTRNMQEQILRAQNQGVIAQEAAIARHRGVSEELIRQREAMQLQLQAAEEMNRMQQAADALRTQLRNPGEVFEDRLRELREMLREGMIGPEFFSRGVNEAYRGLMQAAPQQQDRQPAALLAGSVQETQAIVRAQMQTQQTNRNPQERVREVLERMREQNVQQQELMRDLVEEARRGFIANAG